jgi:osmotically-inducible protein OsmY
MSGRRRRGGKDESEGLLGPIAIGGPVLGGVYGAARSWGGGESSLGDLGEAPIGSDPWLHAEVSRAVARARGVGSGADGAVDIEVEDAVVSVRGVVRDREEAEAIERAARSIEGAARFVFELAIAEP